jgi:hypothetical protein
MFNPFSLRRLMSLYNRVEDFEDEIYHSKNHDKHEKGETYETQDYQSYKYQHYLPEQTHIFIPSLSHG